jgi:hypothetical protein
LGRRHGRAASVNVTVPLSSLIGIDDSPAELAGYGPIPADVARRIAAHGAWGRLLTDPATGASCRFSTCSQPEPGRFTWRAPTGHRYDLGPEPIGPIAAPAEPPATHPKPSSTGTAPF